MNIKNILKSKFFIFSSCIVFLGLAISIVAFCFQDKGTRRVFYFQNMDAPGIFAEIRFIKPYTEDQSLDIDIKQFINDLLLGPTTNRFRNLFAYGTKLESCFLRDGILYVNISKEALLLDSITTPIKEAYDIFIKNILNNFSKVKEVELYINNIKAFDY